MDYVNIDIRVAPDPEEKNYYLVTASTTGRTAQGRFYFSAETWQSVEPSLIALGAREAAGAATREQVQQVRNFGKQLFNSLINGEVRSLYDYKRQDAVKNPKILRLRLTLVPSDLVVLPWEILFDERYLDYLCLTKRPKTVLIRSIDSVTHRRNISAKYDPPLRILGMIADPTDLPSLQSQLEKKIIEEALQPLVTDEKVYLGWKPGRVSELDELPYSTDRWDVFHFIGHGRFDEPSQKEKGQGQLAFENEDDKNHARYIPTEHFCESLPPATKLVVLNACETARGNHFNRLSNIAYSLATQKIPAVVAMQFKILDTASNSFSETFYKLLAQGTAVDEAVAEARREIYKTASDKDRLDWAAPILYISSSKAFSFKTDLKQERKRVPPTPVSEKLPALEQEVGVANPLVPVAEASSPSVTLPLDPDETTGILPPEPEVVANPSVPVLGGEPPVSLPPLSNRITVVLPLEPEDADNPPLTSEPNEREKNVPPTDSKTPPGGLTAPFPRPFQLPPSIYGIPRRVYIPVASILIFMLVLGGVFVLPSLLSKPPLFPVLCSANFQSANTAMVPTPATSTSPDGETIGLSEGTNIFDLQRPNKQPKLQAAQAITNDPQSVVPLLKDAISSEQTDAEAQIYLENWKVLGSNHPHITFVVGVSFAANSAGASRGALQGAFTAQKECNNQNQLNSSKTQIVLMIANIGGNNSADRASGAKFVANQIANQAVQDKTIVGIMAWPTSTDTINVNVQLQSKGSSLPMISPSASSDDLGGMSYFFRVCPLNKEEAQVAANFMLNTKHKKRIGVVYDQTTAYSINLRDDFASAKDIPNNTVGSASFTGGDSKTLQDALTDMLDKHPDAIFFSGYANDLVALLNAISSTPSANLLIVGGDALATTNDYPNPLPNLRTVYFTAFASPNQWDGTNLKPPFFQDYEDNFGTLTAPTGLSSIDTHALLGYDALLTLLHGTEQVLSTKNTINASDLTQALKRITGDNAIQGVTGHIAFDSIGNQDQHKMIFVEHIEGTNLVIDEKHGCLLKDNCANS